MKILGSARVFKLRRFANNYNDILIFIALHIPSKAQKFGTGLFRG